MLIGLTRQIIYIFSVRRRSPLPSRTFLNGSAPTIAAKTGAFSFCGWGQSMKRTEKAQAEYKIYNDKHIAKYVIYLIRQRDVAVLFSFLLLLFIFW